MKKYIFIITGVVIILIGFGMFCFGVSMFAYQGPPLSEFKSKLGEFSFSWWFPTIIFGAAVLVVSKIIKSN
ncbi:MAG TPA: hypothetical protein VGN20_22645 [Mucilaginibacter sp.]|jgi:hypothetical protein